MIIRRWIAGDGAALRDVFHSAVHRVAARDYTPQQLAAWAPERVDMVLWAEHLRQLNPFVAELDGHAVGYADVQASGYIDHFYVSGRHPRQGIGTALMCALDAEARRLGLSELFSHVSITAQPFFARFGFDIVEQRNNVIRGVEVPNARMRKRLTSASS